MRLIAVVIAAAAASHVASPIARADSPSPLAPALRAMIWGGFCDDLQQHPETDCTKTPERCWAKRGSTGEAFEPVSDLDRSSVGYPYALDNWLSYAAGKSDLPETEDERPLSRLTGVKTPERSGDDGWVSKLDAAQIRWIVQNLAPKPDDELCGAPASKLYDVVGAPLVKRLAGAYLHLHQRGAFKNFDREKYTNEYHEPKGRYTKMCKAFIGKPKGWGEGAYRKFACGFWFRREYGNQRVEFVQAFADVLAPFDPAMSKKLLKTLPKPQ